MIEGFKPMSAVQGFDVVNQVDQGSGSHTRGTSTKSDGVMPGSAEQPGPTDWPPAPDQIRGGPNAGKQRPPSSLPPQPTPKTGRT